MVRTHDLRYSYRTSKEIVFPDFNIFAGDHLLLLGNSGSGKTTLLHLLGGLLKSQHGSIHIRDTEIGQLNEHEKDQFRGNNIGFIFQRNHLISALSVQDNLLLASYLAGHPADTKRASTLLTRLDIGDKIKSKISQLSEGQAQRVAIARAVMNNPSLILADEPTSALDDKNCQQVIELLFEVATENKATLIIATHDLRLKTKVSNYLQLKSL